MIIPVTELSDPRLADYSHQTDVALKKARGTEHGIYLAESALVLSRALAAGLAPYLPPSCRQKGRPVVRIS